MKVLVLILLTAACGGSSDDPVIVVDGPPGGGNGDAANARNDMVLVSFPSSTLHAVQTATTDDQPDNQAAPLAIASTGATKIAGAMGVGGDHSDDYVERDTYLIQTAADVNQLTIRLAWDDRASDHDFVLFEEPAAGADPVEVASGTRISNVDNELETFPIDGGKSYWLWTGVFEVNATDAMGVRAAPTLPSPYDLSLYGEAFDTVAAGGAACSYTEAADSTNDTISNGATGTAELSDQIVTTAGSVYCGALDAGHFVPATNPVNPGVVDADTFSLEIETETPVVVTLVGATAADQTALASMTAIEYLILDNTNAFFERGVFSTTHGVLTTTLPATIDPMTSLDTGPKAISIIGFNMAAIDTSIHYKLTISADNPDTRAPRVTAAADVTEAHDL